MPYPTVDYYCHRLDRSGDIRGPGRGALTAAQNHIHLGGSRVRLPPDFGRDD